MSRSGLLSGVFDVMVWSAESFFHVIEIVLPWKWRIKIGYEAGSVMISPIISGTQKLGIILKASLSIILKIYLGPKIYVYICIQLYLDCMQVFFSW